MNQDRADRLCINHERYDKRRLDPCIEKQVADAHLAGRFLHVGNLDQLSALQKAACDVGLSKCGFQAHERFYLRRCVVCSVLDLAISVERDCTTARSKRRAKLFDGRTQYFIKFSVQRRANGRANSVNERPVVDISGPAEYAFQQSFHLRLKWGLYSARAVRK